MARGNVKKHTSISNRLILNAVLIVGAILVALDFSVVLATHNTYYNQVSEHISEIALSYNRVPSSSAAAFEAEVLDLAEEFPFKSQVEVQFLDKNGKVIVSSSGFLPEGEIYGEPATESGVRLWNGKLSTGDRVIAASALVIAYDGSTVGMVRCITSLELVDRQIMIIALIITSAGVLILLFAVLLGKFYAQSIIKPIKEVSGVAHRIAAGDLKYRIEIQEFNEIGELCDTINYMADELQSTENMKNEFISSVSHELRTPLTAIKGWGETVKGSIYTDSGLVEKGINVILSETERLSGLVEELLDFSRMQSGRMTYKTEMVDLLAELGEAVCIYEESARRAGVTLIYSEPEHTPYIMGDSDRLMQVFVNVIDNAVKYNKEGGSVTVTVTSELDSVTVQVTDTGVGIPAADLDMVKEKFYKANKTVRGSGIGLAVADEIVRHHNGILAVASTEGVGTTITVTLPVITESESGTKEDTDG